MPATLGDQLHAIAARWHFDFQRVLNLQLKVQEHLGIVGNHDIAHIEVAPVADAITQGARIRT
ncbi:hypothetical protein D3C76_1336340 [compost metagenome]